MQSGNRTTSVGRAYLLTGAAVLLLALIAMAASLQGLPRFALRGWLQGIRNEQPITQPSESGTPTPSASPPPQVDRGPQGNPWVTGVIVTLIALFAAWLLHRLFLVLRDAWRGRAARLREGAETVGQATIGVRVEAEPDAPTVQLGIAGALQRLDEVPDVADAIVAAWLGLEQTASASGLQRGVSETPGEFVVRIIARHQDARADTQRLLRLYEGVRFGGHAADESDREAARSALRRIEQVWS